MVQAQHAFSRLCVAFLTSSIWPNYPLRRLIRSCASSSLATFHKNKEVFLDHGVRDHFNIPKIYGLLHYSSLILLFGTTDNYNTEQTERLHIDFIKHVYRAMNHKDKYNQMTTWLEWQEKLQ